MESTGEATVEVVMKTIPGQEMTGEARSPPFDGSPPLAFRATVVFNFGPCFLLCIIFFEFQLYTRVRRKEGILATSSMTRKRCGVDQKIKSIPWCSYVAFIPPQQFESISPYSPSSAIFQGAS